MTTPMSEARLKICRTCKINKSLSDFYKKGRINNDPRSDCKLCMNIKQTKYEKEIQEKHKNNIIKLNNTQSKTCTKCNTNKNITEFSRDNSCLSGFRAVCKNCNKEYSAKQLKNKNYTSKANLRKKNRYHNSVHFRLKENIVSRMNLALKGKIKSARTEKLLGCTIAELKIYLENKFKEGMSWDNRSEWHIDHIKPCASFDLSKEEEQKKCFNYTNLQPLWARENILKKDKV